MFFISLTNWIILDFQKSNVKKGVENNFNISLKINILFIELILQDYTGNLWRDATVIEKH